MGTKQIKLRRTIHLHIMKIEEEEKKTANEQLLIRSLYTRTQGERKEHKKIYVNVEVTFTYIL